MNKLLVICGPTTTGKTSLALSLAKKFNGDLISADSRQVYKGMDIGTGKDIPSEFKNQKSKIKIGFNKKIYALPVYTDGKTNIWMYDVVNPDEEFSLAHFRHLAIEVIQGIWKRGRLPIVVGGTGLYIRALLEPLENIAIPRNLKLRKIWEQRSVRILQTELQQTDRKRLEDMNTSDQANPRRLIRALEIALWNNQNHLNTNLYESYYRGLNTMILGLHLKNVELEARIRERIKARLDRGLLDEINRLRDKGYGWNLPAMSGLGYRQWRDFFEHKKSKEKVIQKWIQDELQYAKRQIVWFKKQPHILWHDASTINLRNMKEMIAKWYNK